MFSSPQYIIDCTDSVVVGDKIKFTENVFEGNYPERYQIGFHIVWALVQKWSKRDIFTLKVISSKGCNILERGEIIHRKARNVYRNGTMRCRWKDENRRGSIELKPDKKYTGEFPRPWTPPLKKRLLTWYMQYATTPGLLVETTYDTGVEIRMSVWSHKDKPIDWDRAARLCNSAYALRYNKRVEGVDIVAPLPQIVSMREINTGEEFFPPRPNNQRSIAEYRGS